MKYGNCKQCGCKLCKLSIRPDNSQFIGCSNCDYTIEIYKEQIEAVTVNDKEVTK